MRAFTEWGTVYYENTFLKKKGYMQKREVEEEEGTCAPYIMEREREESEKKKR